MPFIDSPGVCSVEMEYEDEFGNFGKNRLHVSNGGADAWVSADLGTLAGAIDSWVSVGDGTHELHSYFGTGTTLQKIACRDLSTEASTEYVLSPAHAGSNTNAPIDAGLTKAITLRTGVAGRSYRGRVYQPFLCSDFVDSTNPNQCDSARLIGLINAWSALLPAVAAAGDGWVLCVLSLATAGAPRAEGVGTPVISVGYSDQNLDFQRRRAPGQRRHLRPVV